MKAQRHIRPHVNPLQRRFREQEVDFDAGTIVLKLTAMSYTNIIHLLHSGRTAAAAHILRHSLSDRSQTKGTCESEVTVCSLATQTRRQSDRLESRGR